MSGVQPVSRAEYDAMVAARMTEAQLQEQVRSMCRMYGWLYYHTHRSQHSPAGFPDVCAVRGGRLLFAELKTQKGKATPAQEEWLERLQAVGDAGRSGAPRPSIALIVPQVYLWRPADLLDGTIELELR